MYIVIGGGGKIAENLAHTLLKQNHEVAIIEENEAVVEGLVESLSDRYMVILGDTCDSNVLEDAGIKIADIFIATTGQDDDNLVACEVASAHFSVPRIIARVNNPKNERIFRKLGIEAISSTSIITRMIEDETMQNEMRMVLSLKQGDLTMMEVDLPFHSKLEDEGGVRVADLELPSSTVIVALGREDKLDTVHGDTVLLPGDQLVVCCKSDREDEVKKFFQSL
ncbi:MAG: TrkA family potassium uptake protein [Coriobacteriia bacterium]|nr:TrkA family potassium uptake protein [Coriobacteriia bacterium]